MINKIKKYNNFLASGGSKFVLWSSDQSILRKKISISAVIEVIAGMLLFWYMAANSPFPYLTLAAFLAVPLLLLRSKRSIRCGLFMLRRHLTPLSLEELFEENWVNRRDNRVKEYEVINFIIENEINEAMSNRFHVAEQNFANEIAFRERESVNKSVVYFAQEEERKNVLKKLPDILRRVENSIRFKLDNPWHDDDNNRRFNSRRDFERDNRWFDFRWDKEIEFYDGMAISRLIDDFGDYFLEKRQAFEVLKSEEEKKNKKRWMVAIFVLILSFFGVSNVLMDKVISVKHGALSDIFFEAAIFGCICIPVAFNLLYTIVIFLGVRQIGGIPNIVKKSFLDNLAPIDEVLALAFPLAFFSIISVFIGASDFQFLIVAGIILGLGVGIILQVFCFSGIILLKSLMVAPGLALGLFLRAILIRLSATIRYVYDGLLEYSENCYETIFVIDFFQVPELVPQAAKVSLDYSLSGLWRDREKIKGEIEIVARLFLSVIIIIPAYAYRLNIKSNWWLWGVVAYALRPTAWISDPVGRRKAADLINGTAQGLILISFVAIVSIILKSRVPQAFFDSFSSNAGALLSVVIGVIPIVPYPSVRLGALFILAICLFWLLFCTFLASQRNGAVYGNAADWSGQSQQERVIAINEANIVRKALKVTLVAFVVVIWVFSLWFVSEYNGDRFPHVIWKWLKVYI